jgi:hypothetical protein
MTERTLGAVDRDGALIEVIGELHGTTRAGFLRTAGLSSAAVLSTLAAPSAASAQVTDLEILLFGLRFERLQATFYTQADELGTIARMPAAKQEWARTLGAHERAHVRIIKQVLGPKAEPRPFFDFGEDTETDEAFTRTAVAMEDLTVALLTGVLPEIRDRGLSAALLGLLTVEARHAAWARNIVGATPAARSFDQPRTLSSVRGAVARTGFIVRQPKTAAKRRRPGFTG